MGQSYKLVVLQSLHSQQEMLEDIRNTFLWAIPVALLAGKRRRIFSGAKEPGACGSDGYAGTRHGCGESAGTAGSG